MTARRTALVCGAGGFIGSHLVRRLKHEGYGVLGVDLKYPEFSDTAADEFVEGDLRDQTLCKGVLDRPYDEVYQLAADMGGAGYIFTGNHDADVMHNSATINLNIAGQRVWVGETLQRALVSGLPSKPRAGRADRSISQHLRARRDMARRP